MKVERFHLDWDNSSNYPQLARVRTSWPRQYPCMDYSSWLRFEFHDKGSSIKIWNVDGPNSSVQCCGDRSYHRSGARVLINYSWSSWNINRKGSSQKSRSIVTLTTSESRIGINGVAVANCRWQSCIP